MMCDVLIPQIIVNIKMLTFTIPQLEPVDNKTFTQDFAAGIDLMCPSEVTYSVILTTFAKINHFKKQTNSVC